MKDFEGLKTRQEWVLAMDKIAYPVLNAMANDNLKVELPATKTERKRGVAYLEAMGRTMDGIAPWLELDSKCIINEVESGLQAKYRILARKAIANAVDPAAKDYCIFNRTGKYLMPDQPIVDAAFFASAILKAPRELWENQTEKVKADILNAFELVLLMKSNRSNWLLFTAIIETCKYKLTGIGDAMRIEYAATKHFEWYKGDGIYGDGDNFYWNYYNSFVIQPMLEEVTRFAGRLLGGYNKKIRTQVTRSLKRYSEVLERMIAPDGSFPFLGRSITYRMAAFQSLAHTALMGSLPKTLPANQARCALDKVIKKALSAPTLFDEQGFLTKGLYGEQPSLANYYTNIGSLYICLTVFLPLGLSAKNKFWASDNTKTTWEKVWSGENMPLDESLEHRKRI